MKRKRYQLLLLIIWLTAVAITSMYFFGYTDICKPCTPSQDTLSINQQLSDISQDINVLLQMSEINNGVEKPTNCQSVCMASNELYNCIEKCYKDYGVSDALEDIELRNKTPGTVLYGDKFY